MNRVWSHLISIFSLTGFISHMGIQGINTKCYLWFVSLLCCPGFGFTLGGWLGDSRRSFGAYRGSINMTHLLLCGTIRQKPSVSSWYYRFFVFCVSVDRYTKHVGGKYSRPCVLCICLQSLPWLQSWQDSLWNSANKAHYRDLQALFINILLY